MALMPETTKNPATAPFFNQTVAAFMRHNPRHYSLIGKQSILAVQHSLF